MGRVKRNKQGIVRNPGVSNNREPLGIVSLKGRGEEMVAGIQRELQLYL